MLNVAHSAEIESFPWFFDKNREIRLALFFEMLTMSNIMGYMIMKLVKLKQLSRVATELTSSDDPSNPLLTTVGKLERDMFRGSSFDDIARCQR